jgi:hypothetical protein
MRTQPTTGNIIRNNTIDGGAMAGIAIASRQEMRSGRKRACCVWTRRAASFPIRRRGTA